MLNWLRRTIQRLWSGSNDPIGSENASDDASGDKKAPEQKRSMAEFLMSMAEQDPEVREAMDTAFFEMQTDEAPNSERHQMYQIIRDELSTMNDDNPEIDVE